MGNYISCTLSAAPANHHSRTTKVILPDGSIRHLEGPANAAELMLDSPGYFLVNSRSVQVGRRFSPLSADEDLEMGNVYAMLPMARLNSVVAAGEVARLLMAAKTAVRRASGGRTRVLPDSPPEQLEPRLKLDDVGEFKYRLSMCRSRRPRLETIAEEFVCSR